MVLNHVRIYVIYIRMIVKFSENIKTFQKIKEIKNKIIKIFKEEIVFTLIKFRFQNSRIF